MPMINVGGRRVKVDDSFLSLTPEQQNETVDEIAQSLGGAYRGHNAPEFTPVGVDGYDPKTGEVTTGNKAEAFVYGANDLPIVGPAMKAGGAAIGAGLMAPFSDKTYGQIYKEMRGLQEETMRDHPSSTLAGNIAGTALVLRRLPQSQAGSRAFGLTGPTLGSRALHSAVTGGAISGADAAVRGGNAGDVVGSTLIGAGVGGAIPAVGAGLRAGYGAVRDRVGSVVRGALNPEGEAGRRVASAMRIDQRNPAGVLGANDIAAAGRNQQPLMNADLGGETTRALARAAANQSPEARGAMERVVSDRFANQGNRVQRLVSRLTGGRTDDLLMIDGLRDAASAANRGAYNRAYANPAAQSMWNEGFEQLMQAPAMQRAARMATTRGGNRAAIDGFQPVRNPFEEVNGRLTLRRNADGSVARPTLQFWDQVQRNLHGDIGKAQRSGDNPLGGDLTALRSRLVTMLDGAVPEFRDARRGAAAFFGAEDAVDAGRMFARSNRMIPEYTRGIRAMNPAERDAFETGFASELIDAARNAGDRRNVIQNMFGSQEAREKMVMAFGQSRAREIEAFVRVENAMDALRGAFGNSTTARQLIESGVIGGGTWWYTGDFNSGIAAAALTQGARMAGRRIDGNVMTRTAEMLLSNDPQRIQRAVQSAAMSPMRMAAIDALTQAAAIGSRSAGAVETGRVLAEQ